MFITKKVNIATMKKVYLGLLACCALSASADTIYVERAQMITPIEMFAPYQTDSMDMKYAAFNEQSYLQDNIHLVKQTLKLEFNNTIERGERLSEPAKGFSTVNLLKFTIDAKRYTIAKLDVKGLSSHKAYIDKAEIINGDLKLLPGRHELVLLCLTIESKKDSFDVTIVGENVKELIINSPERKLYDMSDMLLGDHYHSALLSPTGKYLVINYYNKQEDGSNLFRTTLTETATQRVIWTKNEYAGCTWMPQRDVLYYTRKGNDGRQLMAYNPVDGTEVVLSEKIPDGSFVISPKEDYLLYTITQEGEKPKESLKLLIDPDDRQPGWRNRNVLYRYDLKTCQKQRLTFGSVSVGLNDISRDGQYLLLSYSRMNPNDKPFRRMALLRMNAYTGSVDTLLTDTAYIAGAQFSPDAKTVLVKASPAAFDGIGLEVKEGQIPNAFDYRLYSYNIEAKTIEPLLCGFKPAVGKTMWSPIDGNIYFSATDGYDESLFQLNPHNKKVVKYELPISYIQGYSLTSLSKRPQLVFFGQTGERARDMYYCTLNSPKPNVEKIGNIDFDAWVKNIAIGKCTNWDYLSSRGDTIKGFYFLPPNFDATKKYPLIVYYYGGCTPTAKVLEFQYPLQVLAAQGYVVYVVEPSGAIGFGQEFAARHVNTWGMESADDIIEGTKTFVKEHTFVNVEKIGCMGASYGGFMTQYLQTRTDIFAAAISHAGISNIASYWGGGYWGYTYGEVAQYGSYPWNTPDLYVKQSPLFNAEKINTPILLLHGTVDTNVPNHESIQLFTALRILGKRVSYIQIDGEDHVIVNHKKRLAWQNSIFAWFAYWLKDEPLWWQTLYPNDNFGQR